MRNFGRLCKDYENIENYEKALADDFQGWHCHHRLETNTSDGERREVAVLAKELNELGLYYDRPAEELIFLTAKEHRTLHNKVNKYFLGKHHSEETKNKMSEAQKGKPKSEESKKKMSEAKKGNQTWLGKKHSKETKNKMSEARKGMRWYNNGEVNTMSKECPPGYGPGRILKKKNDKSFEKVSTKLT